MVQKIIFILIMSMLLSTCRTLPKFQKPIKPRIDPEVVMYVNDFIIESKGIVKSEDLDNISVIIKEYPDDDYGILGTCFFRFGGNYVVLNKDHWYGMSHIDRKELVFHELGHCVLYRHHTMVKEYNLTWYEKVTQWFLKIGDKLGIIDYRPYLPDYCPSSIMHPYSMYWKCLYRHYDYYMKELYNPKEYYNYLKVLEKQKELEELEKSKEPYKDEHLHPDDNFLESIYRDKQCRPEYSKLSPTILLVR